MSKVLENAFEAPLDGISLVEASAGTGKTYNITSLYVRAVLEKNLLPSQILVMTYTEAATAELKYRIRNRLNESLEAIKNNNSGGDNFLSQLLENSYDNAEEKLRKAIDSFDEAAVLTIHGFCSRLLTEYSLQFDVSPNFELLTDNSELLQDCVDDYWRSFIASINEESDTFILLDYLTDSGFGPDNLKSVLKEVLNHPQAVLEPQEIDLNELLKEAGKLDKIFQRVKYYWEEEGETLREIYYGDSLNRGIYRKSTEEKHWNSFQYWLKQPRSKISYPDELEKFGLKISRSGKKSAPDIPELKVCEAIDEYRAKADHLKLLKPAFIKESLKEIKADYETRKNQSNVLTYNDLLERVEKGLDRSSGNELSGKISRKFPIALVDEFQDTDPIQYSIFRQIYHNRKDTALFMIGDPKQAIYGFRGADIYTYFEAKEDASENQSYSLGANYRSNENMIDAVNELFSQTESPFLIDDLKFQEVAFPPNKKEEVYLNDRNGKPVKTMQGLLLDQNEKEDKKYVSEHIYTAIADEILELLGNGYTINGEKVKQKDIAILIRKGFEGEEIQNKLKERGLKSVMRSRNSVYHSREADELFLILKSVYKPSYEPGIRAALATEIMGYKTRDILHLLENEQEWAYIIEKILEVKDSWEHSGIESAIDLLMQLFSVQQKMAELPDAERRITNLLHISELLAKAQREQRLTGIGLIKWFYHKLNDDSSDSEDEQLRLESDEDLIQITTMHGAKGLEFNIVFCPFLWEEGASIKSNEIFKFHMKGKTHLDISLDASHSNKSNFEELTRQQQTAESIRLSYVALTRSVAASYVLVPKYKKIEESPLGILFSENDYGADFNQISDKMDKLKEVDLRQPVSPKHTSLDQIEPVKFDISEAAQFNRNDLSDYPRIISYSLLARGHEEQDGVHDYDIFFDFNESDKETGPEILDMYSFPKGANAGTCLHKIFEDISFGNTEQLDKIVSENLAYFGFDEKWEKPVSKWIKQCLNQHFVNPNISLTDIAETQLIKEMEFLFPVKNIKSDEIWQLIRDKEQKPLSDIRTFGYMKGYIDLTFQYEDQFFILDYKSNYLGDSSDDYAPDKLKSAIDEAGYDLQYHIYTLALHRYLKHRMADYSYEKHFGGVLYYFIRGVDLSNSGSGLFFDRPDYELIQQMDSYFRSGGDS